MTLLLPSDMTADIQTITGWGRTNPVNARVVRPATIPRLRELMQQAPPNSLIPRGLGRSYGDAAQLQDGAVIELSAFNSIRLDSAAATVTAGAGVSFDRLLRVLVPAGFFLPVTPGTRNVTVGGAIAPLFHPLDGVRNWNRVYGPDFCSINSPCLTTRLIWCLAPLRPCAGWVLPAS